MPVPPPVYYVSAHSSIPDVGNHIDKIPPGTYLVMTTQCGNLSYVENKNFLHRLLGTEEGVKYLTNYITSTNAPVYFNDKRIYRPGNKGPVNQVLEFAKNAKNAFFIGIQQAPINVRKIQGDATERIKQIPRVVLIQVYNEIVHDNQLPELMSTEKLIKKINQKIHILVGGTISQEQVEKIILDPQYSHDLFVTGKERITHVVTGNKSIDQILKEGPTGIYIVDACRGIYGVSEYEGLTRVKPVATQKYRKTVEFPIGQHRASIKHIVEKSNYKGIKRRVKAFRKRKNELQAREMRRVKE